MIVSDQTDKTSLLSEHTVIKMNKNETGYAKLVVVIIEFMSIGEVDTTNEKYDAEVKIISKWVDDEEIEEYDKKKHWYPQLFIVNAFYDVKEEITYHVDRIEKKSIITETRIAKGKFWERIELHNFPIDIQELSITFASRLRPNKVKLISDTSKMSNINSEAIHTFRDQQKYRLYKMVKVRESAYDVDEIQELKDNVSRNITIKTSDSSLSKNKANDKPSVFREVIQEVDNKKKSRLIATCYCSRRPGYYIMNVYSFNFLITVLSLTIFAIEVAQSRNRISGTFTLILTSVSFKTALSKSIPTISYMTSLDRYQIISIIYLVLCCVWHAIITALELELKTKVILDNSALIFFAAAFSLIQIQFGIGILLAYRKIKELVKREAEFAHKDNLYNSDDEE